MKQPRWREVAQGLLRQPTTVGPGCGVAAMADSIWRGLRLGSVPSSGSVPKQKQCSCLEGRNRWRPSGRSSVWGPRPSSGVEWRRPVRLTLSWAQASKATTVGVAHNVGWLELLASTTNAAFGWPAALLGGGAACVARGSAPASWTGAEDVARVLGA
jgi:hypothetical protein